MSCFSTLGLCALLSICLGVPMGFSVNSTPTKGGSSSFHWVCRPARAQGTCAPPCFSILSLPVCPRHWLSPCPRGKHPHGRWPARLRPPSAAAERELGSQSNRRFSRRWTDHGQFAPMLPDFTDRCVAPSAGGYSHPRRPKVAPKLTLRRPSSLVAGFTIQLQRGGRATVALLSPPQRRLLPMSAVLPDRFQVYALRSSIEPGGCVPPLDVDAGATPCRGLEALPAATVWNGYTTTIGGSVAMSTHASSPVCHTNVWCPPWLLSDHITEGWFGDPSKRGTVLVFPPQRHLLPRFDVPLNRFNVHGPWAPLSRLASRSNIGSVICAPPLGGDAGATPSGRLEFPPTTTVGHGYTTTISWSAALRSSIESGGYVPPKDVGAGATPRRGLEVLPTTTVGQGYTTTIGGSLTMLTHACIPFYHTKAGCPPCLLSDHTAGGWFGDPSKRGDLLLFPPQRHLLPIFAVPLNRFKVHGPWASFILFASRSDVDSVVCAPSLNVGAGATPSGLEIPPTTTVGHGCSTTISGSTARVTQEGISFHRSYSWCPPCFLADHIIRGLSGGPSKLGVILLSPPRRRLLSIFAVPLSRFKVHGPWASFVRLAMRSSVDSSGWVPPPDMSAGATPSRWLEVIPETTFWHGYTTTFGGSIAGVTHVGTPFCHPNSWYPPCRASGFFAARELQDLLGIGGLYEGRPMTLFSPLAGAPHQTVRPRSIRREFLASLSCFRRAESQPQVPNLPLPSAPSAVSAREAKMELRVAWGVDSRLRVGGLGLKSIRGSGVGISLGRFSSASGGPGLGLEVSVGFASLRCPSLPPSHASVPRPPPQAFCFSAPQPSWVANTLGPPPPPPQITGRRPSGILSGLGCPLTPIPASSTPVFPPVAPSAESAQHAADKGDRVGIGQGIEVRLEQRESTARLSLGLGLEARGRKGRRLSPRPGLGRFSPPEGVIVPLERPARRTNVVVLCTQPSLCFYSESIAEVRHPWMASLSSTPRRGRLPLRWVEVKTCPLTALPCSPPSLPPSLHPPFFPLLFCFSHLSTPQWRQIDNFADITAVLGLPPPPPSPISDSFFSGPPLTSLPCSPPSLPPSPLPPLSPLLFCFSPLWTPQWRQFDNFAVSCVFLGPPPPPPLPFPVPPPPDPPLPPIPPPPGVASGA